MAKKIVQKIIQIPDDKLDLFEKLVSMMDGAVKDAEKPETVANDCLVDTVKKLFDIFDDKKIADKGLTQQDVDNGRKLVEELVDYRVNIENKLLGLLTTNSQFKDEEENAKKMSKEGRKLVKELAVLPYHHPRAYIAVDVVVFGILPDKEELCVFLQRDDAEDKWALPGRMMRCGSSFEDEKYNKNGKNWTLEETMRDALVCKWEKVKEKKEIYVGGMRVFREESSEVDVSYPIRPNIDLICQLEAMSAIDRDDRPMRVVSVPYMTLVRVGEDKLIPSNFPKGLAEWRPVSELIDVENNFHTLVELAHDHSEILKNGLKRLYQEVRTRPIGGNKEVVDKDVIEKFVSKEDIDRCNYDDYVLLSSKSFDASQIINKVYDVVLRTMGVSVERSNLRKLLLERGVIEEVSNSNQPRGGGLYRFNVEKYKEYKKHHNFGFNPKPKGIK